MYILCAGAIALMNVLSLVIFLFMLHINYSYATNVNLAENPVLVSVEKAYLRASIPGSNISAAYMTIVNNGEKTVTLLGASSNISPRIEIHQNTMKNNMMRMRKMDIINIKANERITLQPSGIHLMLFDVIKPLQPQQDVELTLHFSNSKPVSLQVPVLSPIQEKSAQNSDEQHSHIMQHHH